MTSLNDHHLPAKPPSRPKDGHTPGPWEVDSLGVIAPNRVRRGPQYRRIANCFSVSRAYAAPELDAENAANARLIAAAPDLLASLRDLLEVSGVVDDVLGAAKRARATIAKAES